MEVGEKMQRDNRIKRTIDKINNYKYFLTIIIAFVTFIWGLAIAYYKFNENLKIIQKSTLRNTIWNENIPMRDRLESCDSYLALGYNSETKKYCGKLLGEN